MKFQFVIIFILFFYLIGYSQTDTVYISGKVSAINLSNKEEAVKNAIVQMRLSNGELLECKTNDTGYYFFKQAVFNGEGELIINTDYKTTFISSKTNCFVNNSQKTNFVFSLPTHLTKQVTLQHLADECLCGDDVFLPVVYFKFNSLELNQIDTTDCRFPSLNKVLDFYSKWLINNPTLVLAVDGNCDSREKDKEQLSLNRAQVFIDELIKKGIEKERLIAGAWGTRHLLIKDHIILKAKTKEEKEALHNRNRRVTIRVMSWDYIPKTQKP